MTCQDPRLCRRARPHRHPPALLRLYRFRRNSLCQRAEKPRWPCREDHAVPSRTLLHRRRSSSATPICPKSSSVCHDDLETACAKIHEKLVAGIEKRLVADAKVGFLLSGGLDSSLVCAVAARKSDKRRYAPLPSAWRRTRSTSSTLKKSQTTSAASTPRSSSRSDDVIASLDKLIYIARYL